MTAFTARIFRHMNTPSKIHLTTRAYLKRWTVNGLLRPVHPRYGPQKPKHPSAVAYERDWWSKGNPALNAACEEQCGKIETLIPDLLPRVQESWPLNLEDRATLAQLMALHVTRTAAFSEWFAVARDESLPKYEDRFTTPEGYERFRSAMFSDEERAKKILRINKLATVLGSMHWSLLTFENALLATSDQPVAPVPLLGAEEQEAVSPTPRRGWLETLEVRFPLSPHEALLATWYGALDGEGEPIPCDWAAAVNLNGITRAQAPRYFHSPSHLPAMPPAILREPLMQFEPLAPSVLPGYGTQAAFVSERRSRTSAEVTRLIEANDDATLTLIIADRLAA